MRVLAVDTTTVRGSLAIVGNDGVLAEARLYAATGHSRWLLSAADALLVGLGLAARDLDAFAVTIGPGSFTGLRVGLSTIQGLALASDRPIVALSSLDVLAQAAAGASDSIVTLVDAFRGEVYCGRHGRDGTPRGGPTVGPLEDALAGIAPGSAFVGDAVAGARATIGAAVPEACFPEVDLHLAAPLGRAALDHVAAGAGRPASEVRPLYLRGVHVRPAP